MSLAFPSPPSDETVVLTREEVRAVLNRLDGTYRLIATLLYGCGLRQVECGCGRRTSTSRGTRSRFAKAKGRRTA
jgi:hypothetical protein